MSKTAQRLHGARNSVELIPRQDDSATKLDGQNKKHSTSTHFVFGGKVIREQADEYDEAAATTTFMLPPENQQSSSFEIGC